jgi:hypothetical protein
MIILMAAMRAYPLHCSSNKKMGGTLLVFVGLWLVYIPLSFG